MITGRFETDSAVYLKYIGDGDGGEALYCEYELSGVMVAEKRYADENGVVTGRLELYFFCDMSICETEGTAAAFPEFGKNDRCEVRGRRYRVSVAEVFPHGITVGKYLKLTLK